MSECTLTAKKDKVLTGNLRVALQYKSFTFRYEFFFLLFNTTECYQLKKKLVWGITEFSYKKRKMVIK